MISIQPSLLDGHWLFSQSDAHLVYTLSEFNAYYTLPMLAGKCRVFYEDDRPVGLTTWAWFTDEEASDFLNMDWTPTEETYARDSGDQLWGIEFIAPFGHARPLMREMRKVSRDLYGEAPCNWRRLHDLYRQHTIRRF